MNLKTLINLMILFIPFLGVQASLLNIRMAQHGAHKLRIVFDCSAQIKVNKSIINNQLRILKAPLSPNFAVKGRTTSVKSAHHKGQDVVISFHEMPCTETEFWIAPGGAYPFHRYVLDLTFKGGRPTLNLKPKPPKQSTKKRILIDAGHGGRDPGALGVGRVYEKRITFRTAKILYNKLKASGRYHPILVRRGDQSIPISKRLRFAKTQKADLFLSLHADSCRDPSVRGLSLYTLSSVASDRQAARLAQKENKADLKLGIKISNEIPEVANILIDLTKREKRNLSLQLAHHLVDSLRYHVFLLRKPHRFANFYILKLPAVPSVLIELGYLSNKMESKLLQSDKHLNHISNGILKAIDTYFSKAVHETRP